jgi:hypothetical protein
MGGIKKVMTSSPSVEEDLEFTSAKSAPVSEAKVSADSSDSDDEYDSLFKDL